MWIGSSDHSGRAVPDRTAACMAATAASVGSASAKVGRWAPWAAVLQLSCASGEIMRRAKVQAACRSAPCRAAER